MAGDSVRVLEAPTDMNLNLMEVLKASDYSIEATCGGMALCATCLVDFEAGFDHLLSRTDAELDMLDTLPVVGNTSRLACQVKIDETLDGAVIRVPEK
jgi:2Fe-2S ferredoxin